MRFIGDVHTKFGDYLYLTDECEASIQVGDFGIGIRPVPDILPQHRFIRGNHDSPQLAKNHPNWIPDGHIENGMFFLGGGFSIDRHNRTEGVDWWADEELNSGELYTMIDRYVLSRPDVLVCHECPAHVVNQLFKKPKEKMKPSRTSNALASMVEEYPPKLVIHGHWHQARDKIIDKVRYISLPELGFIDL